MKVTILARNLSQNSLGRAHVLAEAVQRFADVEIVGPKVGDMLWEPLRGSASVEIKAIDSTHGITAWKDVVSLGRSIEGDVLYASKPYLTTFGVALLVGQLRDIPVIVDIDDWERGFREDPPGRPHVLLKDFLGALYDPNRPRYLNLRLHESLVGRADGVTVSNPFLHEKFGGTVIPHVKDKEMLDPSKYAPETSKRKLGLRPDVPYVGFIGTPRSHKGTDLLVRALEETDDAHLLLVGATESGTGSDAADLAREQLGGRAEVLPPQPYSDLPVLLSAADIIAVPQRDTPAGRGQLPSKLFDAMAMGKPIVSTRVGNIPEVLGDGGLVVPPDDAKPLSEAIQRLIESPKLREQLGSAARSRFLERYTVDRAASILEEEIERIRREK